MVFAMPHCTSNFAWYLGKFVLGFAGILFLYLGFVNEKDVTCICKARGREAARNNGAGDPHRCLCRKGFRTTKTYACGCTRRLLSKSDVRCTEKFKPESTAEDGCCCTRRRA
ncbi:uncharacterized protein LOC112494231 isoform X2 [Cephus cinctus]|uniref:Uncharacterized protein LOC112494231 isoform X2 n=1 Tax=Cephus cinctus TaxID=211228 RepID=A0AAJ7RFI9_CEPCN|nr:uncharacterized protein LOC112494231 isoform X2 [Cephus cinctus]